MTKPWDRRAKETDQAWAAFTTYRDQGLDRSLAKVGEALGKSGPLMERWSATHAWVSRATAWDIHLDQVLQRKAEARLGEMAARHIASAKALMGVPTPLLEELARRAKAGKLDKDLRYLSVEELVDLLTKTGRLVKVGVDVERLSSGEPTEIQRNTFATETRARLSRVFDDEEEEGDNG